MRFEYKSIDRPKPLGPKTMPILPIRLIGKSGEQFDTPALLDSGADYSVIFEEHARILGIDSSKLKSTTVQGVGGASSARLAVISVHLKGPGERRTFALELPFMILPKHAENHPILLGRSVFFEKFEITFNELEKTLTLKPLSENGW